MNDWNWQSFWSGFLAGMTQTTIYLLACGAIVLAVVVVGRLI